MKLQNLKKKLSQIKLEEVFKFAFAMMVVIVICNVIFFVKNASEHRFLMCTFNAVTFTVVGYHSLLVLLAIHKKEYERNVLLLVGIDLCTLAAYVLCPLYIIVAFMNHQVDFVLPIGLCALILHFFALPVIRNWLKK